MTMMPDFRICHKCKNMWSWNPDVGTTECPYCQKKKMEKLMKISSIFSGKKRKKDDKDEE